MKDDIKDPLFWAVSLGALALIGWVHLILEDPFNAALFVAYWVGVFGLGFANERLRPK